MLAAKTLFENLIKSPHYNKIFHAAKLTKLTPEILQATVSVTDDNQNGVQTLHGGYISGMVDFLSTVDLMRKGHLPGVTVDLSVKYLRGAKVGSNVHFESRILKAGRNMAFCEVDLFDAETRALLARGSHVKFIGK